MVGCHEKTNNVMEWTWDLWCLMEPIRLLLLFFTMLMCLVDGGLLLS
jgi:hypothetical protein